MAVPLKAIRVIVEHALFATIGGADHERVFVDGDQ